MTQLELLQEAERVTRLHNDAFLVEFLGAERAGLAPETQAYLTPKCLRGGGSRTLTRTST
jgi:hypothetical protein